MEVATRVQMGRFGFYLISLAPWVVVVVGGGGEREVEEEEGLGFFHPFTNDNGRGERVIWCAVKAIQEELPDLNINIAVHTCDEASPESLAARALDRSSVKLLSLPKTFQRGSLVVDMSTTILTLSEDGDLQRMHKWLSRDDYIWLFKCAGRRRTNQ